MGNKMKKMFVITLVVIGTILLLIPIYFISEVSSVIPPIKEYSYTGSVEQFISNISKNPKLQVKIIDTVGDKQSGFAVYVEIQHSEKTYQLKCQEDYLKEHYISNIRLISAFNFERREGGYTHDSKGMGDLLNDFESVVLKVP